MRAGKDASDSAARLGTLEGVPSLHARLKKLYDALQDVPADTTIDASVVDIYNTLLRLAQDERPRDAVLRRMSEVTDRTEAITLRVLVGQIIAMYEG